MVKGAKSTYMDLPSGREYLTRRIRRVVHGSDIDAIFEKQITIPIVIPFDLEEYIERLFREAWSDAGLGLYPMEKRSAIVDEDTGVYVSLCHHPMSARQL